MSEFTIGRGPTPLGRSVLVAPGAATPTQWNGCRRISADSIEAALAADSPSHPTALELAQAWARREPLIIEVDELPTPVARPIDDHFWMLDATTVPPLDAPLFHLRANAIDYRSTPRWDPLDAAVAAGAAPADPSVGDIIAADGMPAWIDGGPLEWLSGVDRVIPRLHIGIGSIRPLSNSAQPHHELTEHQLHAVTHQRGPARIIAPAGSGKTRVLTERLRLITRGGLSPGATTLVAYNVRAQAEMAERLDDVPGVRVSTLHALALRILRTANPGSPRPEVVDEIGVRRLLEPLVPHLRRRADNDALEAWVDGVNSCRDSLASPSDIERRLGQVDGLEQVVVAYRERLRRSGMIDYSDMVLRACEALLADPHLLRRVRNGVGMLLIDEFQDLTPALMLLVRLLAGPANEVFCVGDDDQTIYGFSGATPRWLVEFDSAFPGAHHHALTINHRCPADVVTAADTLLRHNHLRVAKTIEPRHGAPTHGLSVHQASADVPESGMTTAIAAQISAGARPGEISVLARTNAGLIASYVHLRHAGIPCRPPSGLGVDLLQRSGVAALLAWIDLATSPTIAADSLATALQRPRRSSTPRLTAILVTKSNLDDLERFVSTNNNPKIRDSLLAFCSDLRRARQVVAGGATSRQLIDHILDDIDIATGLDTLDASQRAPRRATHRDQLESLRSIAQLEPRPHRLVPFLVGHLPSTSDLRSSDGNRIALDTVHRVKGLEWPHVHVIGVADGSFPHRLAEDIEEERRIFHVALTRCSQSVDIWCGSPYSPFIAELTEPPNSTTAQAPAERRSTPTRRMASTHHAPSGDSLYSALVAWRLDTARAVAKPAYTVFNNAVLTAISNTRPRDLAALGRIAGVGPAKLERWGDEILAIIAAHEPPQ